MPDQIEQYYNYLKGAGADVAPTLQSFRKTLADDKTAKQYYEYLRQNKFDAPDTYESFAGTLGIKKKVGGAPSGLTSDEQDKYNLILQKQQEFMRTGGKQPAKQDNLVLPQPIQKIKTAEQQDGRTVLQKDKDARDNRETALQIQKKIIKEQTSKPGMPAVAVPEPVVDGLNVITNPDEILEYNLRNPEKNKVQVKYEQEQQKKKETEELIEQAQADVFYNTPAGKFYYNIFKPLAKAGGAGLANVTSGTVRTVGDIIGADEITGEWADAIYDNIHPDKRWTEEKTNWMGKTPTPLQGNLFNDGKLNAAKIIPSTVETLTNMAWLFGTAAVGNAAGAGSVPSLVGASYINTQNDYREAGKQAGLKGEALDNFTTMSAGLTSLLEAFSPNKLITGGVKTKLAKEYAEYLAKGYTSKLAFKQASKQLAKEITTENIQEISQGAGDKMVRLLFDKTSEKPLFNDDLSWDGIKDELSETMVLTTFSTGALSTPGAIRNSRPSTFEKSAWYNVAQNPEQFNSFINKQVQEGKIDLPKMQVLTDNYNKYRGAVEQAKQFGFSEHQAVEAAWQIFKGRELDNEYKRIANNPVLKEAVGNEIKEEQKQTGNEVKRIGLGIPDVGGELSGGEVVQIVNHIGDKLGEPTTEMQERIGANEYRVEEIDLKNLYETDAGFKDYVENYDRNEKNKDGLIVPAIMAKDGTIEDGKSRLAQQYINGEIKAKVFKPLITDENQKEGQEELLNAPENTAQQQPVAAKPKQVVLPQQQEYKGRRLKVVYDGSKRVVKAKNGKVIKQDSPEAKRILRQHEDNYNYNFGQPAATEQMPENIAPEQAGRWIAENSNNPAEVAGLYLQEPKQTRFRDKKEELIAEYGIGKFTSSDFAGVDDKANITAGMAKSYFAGKGNAAVQGIDAYAKELSDHYGIEFTPQDVADFIKRFPNREFGATDRSETAQAAAQRFEELTGIPLTDRVAAMAVAQFAPEELVNEARQEEDAEAERPLTEDEILEINSLLQEDFENSDNLDTFTEDETGTIPETDTAADAQPDGGAAAESGGTPVQEGGEQQGTEQDEEIYEQNDDDLIGALAAELENELNNPTELGTGGFASETKEYDAAILRTNEQSNAAFGNLIGLSSSAIERSLEATGRVLWVEYPKQQGDGVTEQQPVPISYKRAADARQLGGGILLAGDQDYSGATLQNIRQEFGTGSQQFKYQLSHVLATRLLQPGNFTGKLLRSNKALSAVDIILDNNTDADSYFLIYNSNGFIKINIAAAAKRYVFLGEQAFWPYAETALQEEVIHAVSDVITTEAEWETIYNELTPDEVASIKELYDKSDLTNKQVAGEYVRMMVQEKVFGVTTELFTLRSTTGLLNTFKKLLSYLKGVFAGNPNRVSKEVIERVERAVREMNAEMEEGRGKSNLGEMGTGGFQSNFNNNATVENFIRRNIGKYSDETIIQAVMKATGQDEKYARGMLDIAKKPLNDLQQEQLNEEVVDENVGELQKGERARNTTRKIPELDIATVQNLSEEAVKYFQKSNAVSLDEANRFIDNKPITDVVNYLLNVKKDGLTDDKRSTLFVAAINKLTALITEAREAGDNTLAESLALNQSQLLNEYMPQTTEWGRAIQIIRLLYQDPKNRGLFADQTAKEVIKKINEDADTPLSKEEEATITELIEEYAKAPEGLRQAELMAKINQFAAEKVNLNVADILTSIWYAKILSGPSTHVTNISANVFNAPFELANFAIRTAVKHKTLKHFAPMMGGFLRGLYRGFSEFGGILATGITTQESQKFFQSPLMETLDWNQVDNGTLRAMLKNPILFSFNPKVLRYVGRLLAGSDAMLQSAGQEAVAAALGEVYATNGAKKGDLRKASDYLFNNKVDIEAAKMQAEKEGFKRDAFKNRMQYNRRVSEIINSKRAFDIFDKSKKEAAKITFNYEPKGIVARSVYNVITFGQKEIKILPFYVPFVRIVTNLVDNMMNYSPVGFVSAGIGVTKDSKGVRKMTGDERAEIFIKGLIGTSTLLALAAVAGDDEDDWFEVTANGTGDMLKNYELQKTGWRPYTITLKNGTSVSYKNTPLFPVFAAIGGARDWDKYKRKENEEASTSEEMKAAAGMFAFSIFDNSWLTGVNDLINTANITDDRGQVKQGLGGFTDKAVRKGVDVTSAFLLSNFSKSMIRYADAFNGKPLTKPDNDFERIVRDVPWVRDQFIDKQITDVWGDPVVNESWMGLSPFRMKPNGFVKDEVIDLLVKNNIWIGRPRANKELYDTETDNTRLMTKDEYYKYYNRAGQLLKQKLYEIKEDLIAVDGDREAMLRLVSEKKQLANEEAFAELFNNE